MRKLICSTPKCCRHWMHHHYCYSCFTYLHPPACCWRETELVGCCEEALCCTEFRNRFWCKIMSFNPHKALWPTWSTVKTQASFLWWICIWDLFTEWQHCKYKMMTQLNASLTAFALYLLQRTHNHHISAYFVEETHVCFGLILWSSKALNNQLKAAIHGYELW